MRKNGFTLAEIMVALSIVAVIATISAPLISSILPDRNKVMFLKAYKVLGDITQELVNDSAFYIDGEECEGLNCVSLPIHEDFQDEIYSGDNKFSYLLAAKMNTIDDPENNNGTVTFQSTDGIQWSSVKTENGYEVTVDFNRDAGPNATYNENPERQDRFTFAVDRRGNITPVDYLSQAYLRNPHKLNDRQNDYATAKSLVPVEEPELSE